VLAKGVMLCASIYGYIYIYIYIIIYIYIYIYIGGWGGESNREIVSFVRRAVRWRP